MGSDELFPRDRGLVVRMVLAAVLTPVVVLGLLALAIVALPLNLLIGIGVVAALGTWMVLDDRKRGPAAGARVLSEADAPELIALVDRLCVVADVPRPEIVLEKQAQPNSWVVDLPGRTPRLHVTQPLLDLLDQDELAAVIAHELSHLANRDAMVMTVVGMPGAVLLRGASKMRGGWMPMFAGQLVAGAIGLISRVGTSALSRQRELAADQGASAITGRPSALASALLKVSGAISQVPKRDLRAAAALDSFHLIAVGSVPKRFARHPIVRRLGATHPPLERRLRALEELQRHAGSARLTLPAD
jgi:heat shock protein HtpX